MAPGRRHARHGLARRVADLVDLGDRGRVPPRRHGRQVPPPLRRTFFFIRARPAKPETRLQVRAQEPRDEADAPAQRPRRHGPDAALADQPQEGEHAPHHRRPLARHRRLVHPRVDPPRQGVRLGVAAPVLLGPRHRRLRHQAVHGLLPLRLRVPHFRPRLFSTAFRFSRRRGRAGTWASTAASSSRRSRTGAT